MRNALLNAAQAASNTAADTVSFPVDALGWLLRKAGVPVPKNALLGSDWMRQQGLTAPVQPGASAAAGETLGLLSPMAAAAKAPQIARGLLQGGENLAARRTLNPQTGAIVWHGSPHKFDKFDSSKIGTGEGAQAYGHGLYLADAEKVASGYRAGGHVNPAVTIDGEAPVNWALSRRAEYMAMPQDTKLALRILADHKDIGMARQSAQMDGQTGAVAALDELVLAGRVKAGDPGNLYKVDLPDEKIARMLDWDAPLSQQAPEVREALAKLPARQQIPRDTRWGGPASREPVGREVYSDVMNATTPTKLHAAEVTEALRRAGIPGIRYLDGGSRGAGTGTRNYVVFPGEENALRILERNGKGLLGP